MIVLRKDFKLKSESFRYNNRKVYVTTNYKSLDTYSPLQRVKLLGVSVTMWREDGESLSYSCEDRNVDNTLEFLNSRLDSMCNHVWQRVTEPERKNIPNLGDGHHIYECHCGKIRNEFSI